MGYIRTEVTTLNVSANGHLHFTNVGDHDFIIVTNVVKQLFEDRLFIF